MAKFPTFQRFRAFCAIFVVAGWCYAGVSAMAENDEVIPVSEAAISTIASAMASQLGGDAADYTDYAKRLGRSLTVLTRAEQEQVLESDPGGLLGMLEAAPVGQPNPQSDEPQNSTQSSGSSAWSEFWSWLSGIWG